LLRQGSRGRNKTHKSDVKQHFTDKYFDKKKCSVPSLDADVFLGRQFYKAKAGPKTGRGSDLTQTGESRGDGQQKRKVQGKLPRLVLKAEQKRKRPERREKKGQGGVCVAQQVFALSAEQGDEAEHGQRFAIQREPVVGGRNTPRVGK